MKKLLIFMLSLTLCVSFVACTSNDENKTDDPDKTITSDSSENSSAEKEIEKETVPSDAELQEAPPSAPADMENEPVFTGPGDVAVPEEKATEKKQDEVKENQNDSKQEKTPETPAAQTPENKNDTAPVQTPPAQQPSSENKPEEKHNYENVDWQTYTSQYEAWVDEFLTASTNYRNDPENKELSDAYNSKLSESENWDLKEAELKEKMKNASPEECGKCATELARIKTKFAEAIKNG